MIKHIFLIFIISFLLFSCQRNQVIKTHGISYLENREKLIVLEKSNKNDVVKVLGQPATKGMTNDNLWIYIERSTTKGKLLKLGRNYLKKNNVLVVEFNAYGLVIKKEFYDKNNMNKINFTKNITENELRKENFIYSFLSSIRQKMESKRK
jgi:outer membrane protein assembly factor BamE (lipoprotein component of BamABCDE complex)